jgi:hypothetical protein
VAFIPVFRPTALHDPAEEPERFDEMALPIRPGVAAFELLVTVGNTRGFESAVERAVGLEERIVEAAVEPHRRWFDACAGQEVPHLRVLDRLGPRRSGPKERLQVFQ